MTYCVICEVDSPTDHKAVGTGAAMIVTYTADMASFPPIPGTTPIRRPE